MIKRIRKISHEQTRTNTKRKIKRKEQQILDCGQTNLNVNALFRAAGDLILLTAYKLTNGKMMPLDGEDTPDPRANLVFAKYRGVKETTLLENLRTVLLIEH